MDGIKVKKKKNIKIPYQFIMCRGVKWVGLVGFGWIINVLGF